MPAYYNEIHPYTAQWLRNLIAAGHIAPGDVDERSIVDVRADDLKGYEQCHFFAGIGGWSLALRLAGWEDTRPVWTGSCPCQPFSSQGKRAKQSDERHLWPYWSRLIAQSAPSIIFGEQVNDAIAAGWLDEVMLEMEALTYSCAALDLPACAAAAPHHRERVWFVCRHPSSSWAAAERIEIKRENAWTGRICNEGNGGGRARYEYPFSMLAHGVPTRMARLRAYGNAIVPQIAAEFIKATM